MFQKFHVRTREALPRFIEPVRSVLIDWPAGCIGCLVCVKTLCPQGAFQERGPDLLTLQDSLDEACRDCLRCVQSCPQRLIHKGANPEHQALGDDYWTPEIISRLWAQATSGNIPVSGAGYGGPFTGPDFDAMWTDMSEIVRPTRDGIHGREYISTSIQLGRRRPYLGFDDQGRLDAAPPPFWEAPLPILFHLPAGPDLGPAISSTVARAAAELTTLYLVPAEEAAALADEEPALAPALSPVYDRPPEEPPSLFWLRGAAGQTGQAEKALAAHPDKIGGVFLDLDGDSPAAALRLAKAGAGVILLAADDHGRDKEGRFIRESIREVHLALVEESVRDEVTLLVWGGIAMAEHVAKAIICGVDGVVIDWPLLLALECRYCAVCTPETCPALIREVDPGWGVQRILNLIGAWRDQLLEVLGAMGIREVRRLRGEMGRAMFYEDLEAEIFGPIFGTRK